MVSLWKTLRQKLSFSLVGLFVAFREEKSLWIYSVFLLAAIGLGIYAELSLLLWAILIALFLISISIEVLNTAIEAAVDMISFQYNVKVKKIKDIASAATFVAAIGATIGVILIFVFAFNS